MSKALGSIPILKEERKIGAGEVAQRIILMLLHIWGSSMRTRVQIHNSHINGLPAIAGLGRQKQRAFPLEQATYLNKQNQ